MKHETKIDSYTHEISDENYNSSKASTIGQNFLPDSQQKSAKNDQDDITQIINRILTLAREISCLSEHKSPVENDSIKTDPQIISR